LRERRGEGWGDRLGKNLITFTSIVGRKREKGGGLICLCARGKREKKKGAIVHPSNYQHTALRGIPPWRGQKRGKRNRLHSTTNREIRRQWGKKGEEKEGKRGIAKSCKSQMRTSSGPHWGKGKKEKGGEGAPSFRRGKEKGGHYSGSIIGFISFN